MGCARRAARHTASESATRALAGKDCMYLVGRLGIAILTEVCNHIHTHFFWREYRRNEQAHQRDD